MFGRLMVAACLCAAPAARAEPVMLSAAEIKELVAGATVEIDAGFGARIPLRFAADGQVAGEARAFSFFLGAASDTGRWWLEQDKLCQRFTKWFDAAPQCLTLTRDGRTIHWQSASGRRGTATVIVPAAVRFATAATGPAPTERGPAPAKPSGLGGPPPVDVAPLKPAAEPEPPKPAAAAATVPRVPPPPRPAPAPEKKVLPDAQPAARVAPAKPEPRPMFMVVNVRADDVLNIRSGPSADHDIVGAAAPGSRDLAVTGPCEAAWCPVEHKATRGWVNRAFITGIDAETGEPRREKSAALRDSPDAPRSCLTAEARALLERIEAKFGRVELVSTCRPGARIAGTARMSRHASGNAVDFNAGSRKAAILDWLVANHRAGGTMTYRDMDHIHVDIGPHFVSIVGGKHYASWRDGPANF